MVLLSRFSGLISFKPVIFLKNASRAFHVRELLQNLSVNLAGLYKISFFISSRAMYDLILTADLICSHVWYNLIFKPMLFYVALLVRVHRIRLKCFCSQKYNQFIFCTFYNFNFCAFFALLKIPLNNNPRLCAS